ncbi:MAG: transposase, partial [Bacteroidales bacterium]|nr:transposase [Bacteroidales bacterium]
MNDLKLLDEDQLQWKNLASIVKITSAREVNNTKTEETRWFISSLNVSAEIMNNCIRKHWQVENSLHWT